MVDLLVRLYSLNERTQNAVAATFGFSFLVLTCALLLLVYDYVGGSISNLEARREQLGQTIFLSRQATRLEKALRADDVDDGDIYLPESNADVASANLQTWLNEQALQKGAQVQSVETSSRIDKNKRTFVTLNASITGKYSDLLQLIAGIENHRPVLFVSEASLTGAAAEEGSSDTIALNIAFGGFLYPDAKGRGP